MCHSTKLVYFKKYATASGHQTSREYFGDRQGEEKVYFKKFATASGHQTTRYNSGDRQGEEKSCFRRTNRTRFVSIIATALHNGTAFASPDSRRLQLH